MLGASTDIVNTGKLPALGFGPCGYDTWPITNNYDGTIRVHVDISHSIYGFTANILFISLFIRKFCYKQNRFILFMPFVHKQYLIPM